MTLALSLQNEQSISRDNYPRHFRCATDADASLPELIYVYNMSPLQKIGHKRKSGGDKTSLEDKMIQLFVFNNMKLNSNICLKNLSTCLLFILKGHL